MARLVVLSCAIFLLLTATHCKPMFDKLSLAKPCIWIVIQKGPPNDMTTTMAPTVRGSTTQQIASESSASAQQMTSESAASAQQMAPNPTDAGMPTEPTPAAEN